MTPVPMRLARYVKHQLDFVDKYIAGSSPPGSDTKRVPISVGATLLAHQLFPKVRQGLGVPSEKHEDKNLVIASAALASWRRTQFIYQFDPELSSALASTPKDVVLVSDVLLRLPAPCVWIESTVQEGRGCFALLDQTDEEDGRKYVLWIVTVNGATEEDIGRAQIQAIVFPLDKPLDEALEEAYKHIEKEARDELAESFSMLVACALYLCSEEPDIEGGLGVMNRKRIARREPPYSPTVHAVGARLGAAFRKARQAHAEGSGEGTHAGPLPHMRRAHWHSYWLGARDRPDQRRKVIKWLPPIAVNVKDGSFDAVTRKVKS